MNIGGAGSYVYDNLSNNNQSPTSVDSAPKAEEKRVYAPKAPSKGELKNVCVYECRYSTFMLYALSIVDIAASADWLLNSDVFPWRFWCFEEAVGENESCCWLSDKKSDAQCLLGLEGDFLRRGVS